MIHARRLRLETVLAVLFTSALATMAYCADDNPTTLACPTGSVRIEREQGTVLGCERTNKTGGVVRVGAWEWRDSERHILFSASYNDWGVEDGRAAEYNASGQLLRENQYVDGKLEGDATSWWPDGHLRELIRYRDGKLNGVRKRWTYAPERKNCTKSDESCWAGSEECWVGGERRPHEDCNGLYAGVAGGGRVPASR